MAERRAVTEPDVILVGAGIMSSTLAVCLKELEPALSIAMFETREGGRL
jgi:malate dehydrogenase (quinone)